MRGIESHWCFLQFFLGVCRDGTAEEERKKERRKNTYENNGTRVACGACNLPVQKNYKNIVSLFYNIIVGIFVFQCKQVLNFIEQQQLCGVIYLSKINNITPSCDISVTSQYLQLGWNYSDIHLQRLNCCQTNNLSSVVFLADQSELNLTPGPPGSRATSPLIYPSLGVQTRPMSLPTTPAVNTNY